MDFLDNYSVLIMDESDVRQDLFASWISSVSTRKVSSPSDVADTFSSTMTVACLSHHALDDQSDSIQKHILSINPYCQIVGVLPRSSFISPYKEQYDDILQRPVFKEDFQQAIEFRFIAGVYSRLLSEYYELNSALVAVERASETEIADQKVSIGKIRNREEELKRRLETLRENLSSDLLLSILQTIERHSQSLKKPDKDIAKGKETKFRPRRCPSCTLPWGVHHRNELGNGYKKLGANVYQCARCDKIIHGLAGDHRVV